MQSCPSARPVLAVGLVLAVLGGCAGTTPSPPSLMQRPIERLSLEEPPAVPLVRAALPGAVAGRATAIEREARAAVAASGRATPAGRSTAARGSDGWIEAQMAASAAGVALVPARGALTELERLIADAATAGQDSTMLERTRRIVADLVAAQQARLEAVTPR